MRDGMSSKHPIESVCIDELVNNPKYFHHGEVSLCAVPQGVRMIAYNACAANLHGKDGYVGLRIKSDDIDSFEEMLRLSEHARIPLHFSGVYSVVLNRQAGNLYVDNIKVPTRYGELCFRDFDLHEMKIEYK
jgi:hypothetical protein